MTVGLAVGAAVGMTDGDGEAAGEGGMLDEALGAGVDDASGVGVDAACSGFCCPQAVKDRAMSPMPMSLIMRCFPSVQNFKHFKDITISLSEAL